MMKDPQQSTQQHQAPGTGETADFDARDMKQSFAPVDPFAREAGKESEKENPESEAEAAQLQAQKAAGPAPPTQPSEEDSAREPDGKEAESDPAPAGPEAQ